MARCGCTNQCACTVSAGDGITVTGSGTSVDPYIVAADDVDAPTPVEALPDHGIAVTGAGTSLSPWQIAAVISTDAGNEAFFGTDGGIYAPAASATTRVVVHKNSAYTATNGDIVLVDASGGPVTITVPITLNDIFTVKKIDTSANAVTVLPAAGLIDNAASQVIVAGYRSLDIVGDGTNAWVI